MILPVRHEHFSDRHDVRDREKADEHHGSDCGDPRGDAFEVLKAPVAEEKEEREERVQKAYVLNGVEEDDAERENDEDTRTRRVAD